MEFYLLLIAILFLYVSSQSQWIRLSQTADGPAKGLAIHAMQCGHPHATSTTTAAADMRSQGSRIGLSQVTDNSPKCLSINTMRGWHALRKDGRDGGKGYRYNEKANKEDTFHLWSPPQIIYQT
jgi:hypothetical protein